MHAKVIGANPIPKERFPSPIFAAIRQSLAQLTFLDKTD
jgi:hypothetical protein